MKKLILMLAGMASAISMQAATVTWGITAISSSAENTAAAGMVGYFLDASTYSAFSALTADKVADYVTDNYTYTGTTTKNRQGVVNLGVASGNYNANDAISGYVVLFDTSDAATAKNYVATSVQSTTISATGANTALDFGSLASNGGWTSTAAVPEPTSGLLMLLGMAGLALKRKRA